MIMKQKNAKKIYFLYEKEVVLSGLSANEKAPCRQYKLNEHHFIDI